MPHCGQLRTTLRCADQKSSLLKFGAMVEDHVGMEIQQ